MKYAARRALRAVVLLFGVSVLCFLFTEMAPGSFFDEMRLNPQISPETISGLRSRYGLDQPLSGDTAAGSPQLCTGTSAIRSRTTRPLRRCCGAGHSILCF